MILEKLTFFLITICILVLSFILVNSVAQKKSTKNLDRTDLIILLIMLIFVFFIIKDIIH